MPHPRFSRRGWRMLAPEDREASGLSSAPVQAGNGKEQSMRNLLIPILAAALAAPAFAAPPQASAPGGAKAEEVRIPFPGFRIRNFRAETRDVVYIEDHRRNWYRAELIGPCIDLPFAHAIGIDTRGSSSFDRFSAILVGRDRCQLQSLTRSEKPQKKAKKRQA
jgi:hypothetical protein